MTIATLSDLPQIVKKSARDFLTKPFYDLVDSPNFSARTQEAKLFVGMTGQGKTPVSYTHLTLPTTPYV